MTTTLDPATAPLSGITVVAIEQAVAAPFATRQLADLGARVIKVERPTTGDFARHYDNRVRGQSSYFVWLNRGKESVTLDLTDAGDRALLESMLARADVFVQNLAPGATDRLGLDPDRLRLDYPGLISCGISGYGTDGPYAAKKAYDLLVQCEAGLVSITGDRERAAKVGISVADIAAGMYAYTGILTALFQRERTGVTTHVSVSMLEALGEWMLQPALFAHYGGTPPPRQGARHASIAPYGPYAVADGQTVFLGVQNEREWARLCDNILGQPDLVDDPRFATNPLRVANDDALTAVIEDALRTRSADDVITALDQAGIANARLRSVEEFLAHPQLAARRRWRQVGTPNGPIRALAPPADLTGMQVVMGDVPAIGAHNAAIRAEFGGS